MADDLKYSLGAVLSALFAAAGLILTEIAVRSLSVSVVEIAVGSNYVAGTMLLGWFAMRGGHRWTGWGRADWFRLVAGSVALAAGFLLLYASIGLVGTSKTSLLGRLETIFIVLLAVAFLKER
ncbi:MAG: EamA family transporter, partial [Candidatus Latescibacteria bacterium]|nr:EamA family transporter [Candidatus Latescibacterota bacterium]